MYKKGNGKVDCTVRSTQGTVTAFVTVDLTISVHLIDHVLEFSLGGVLSQRAHDSSKLFSGDGAIAVLVKQRERLLELWELTQVEASILGT